MNTSEWLEDYFRHKLLSDDILHKYIDKSSVVTVELDEGIVYDLMVIMPDDLFTGEFSVKFGGCFVQNDHECVPPVFTRFKSYDWLRRDFERRMAIALWIFGKSIVIRDPCNAFLTILTEYRSVFKRRLLEIMKSKYVEFRSDRHNLRQAVSHQDIMACALLKANIVKLATEMVFLSMGQSYPYKKWLFHEVEKLEGGPVLLSIAKRFIDAVDLNQTIAISEELVMHTNNFLSQRTHLPSSLFLKWWLYLN